MNDKQIKTNMKNEYKIKYIFEKNSKITVNDILKKSFLLNLKNYN